MRVCVMLWACRSLMPSCACCFETILALQRLGLVRDGRNGTELHTLLVPSPFELFQPQAEASATQKEPRIGLRPGRAASVCLKTLRGPMACEACGVPLQLALLRAAAFSMSIPSSNPVQPSKRALLL